MVTSAISLTRGALQGNYLGVNTPSTSAVCLSCTAWLHTLRHWVGIKSTNAYTQSHSTHTCLQSSHHLVTQSRHLWVAFDGLYGDTDRPQGVQSALLPQTSMENLVLQCGVFSSCDGSLVTPTNDIFVKEFLNDFLCFHFLYKLVPKLLQDFFSCRERAESWYMNQAANSS